MSFKEWMMQQIKKNTARGDLARDMNRDSGFPDADLDTMITYLERRGACIEAVRTLRSAYKKYSEGEGAE